ncbi:MAG: LLM class flavin-dependent oxidoreductase [Armatimonadetes bacterium]|nr:LLM class flavin-dependent oxidoreductase [Armatimonadota bacterium]
MPTPLRFALLDHIEAPQERPSAEVYEEVAGYVRLADTLGFDYYWFSEHHRYVHYGHLPWPMLLALHLASQTKQIQLGTAIICLNLHHPLAIAEQSVVADLLMRERLAPGFGSGSSPTESVLFGKELVSEQERHAHFAEALGQILASWHDSESLPKASPTLHARSWQAVNSVGSAQNAGRLGVNMMYSHLRTPEQYKQYRQAYLDAGGTGLIAANRPVYVGVDDATAIAELEPALRTLWRRFRSEGKIPAETPEPGDPYALCGHPINFLVGGPESVARQIATLRAETDFDVINLEPSWAGLTPEQIRRTICHLAEAVRPALGTLSP